MVDLNNIETQLAARITALDGSQTATELLVLKRACDGTKVDTTALDARIQTLVDGLASGNSDEDLLVANRAAKAVASASDTNKGTTAPTISLPDVYGEARSKGERGWVGKNILDASDAFIPRLNRGLIHKVGTGNAKWSGGLNTSNSGSTATVVGTQDGNVLVIGFVPSNRMSGGSSSSDIVVNTIETSTGDIKSTFTMSDTNINCNYSPANYANISVKEISENYFIGYVVTAPSSSSVRMTIFGFEYIPSTKTCANPFSQLVVNQAGVSANTANYLKAWVTLNATKDEIKVLVPFGSVYSASRQSSQLMKAAFSDTANSKGITANLSAQTASQCTLHVSTARNQDIDNGLYTLSDGNLLLLAGARADGVNGNVNTSGNGYAINVLSGTDGSLVTQHHLNADNAAPDATTPYGNHTIVHAFKLAADKYGIFTVYISGGSNKYKYSIIDYAASNDTVTVTDHGDIPTELFSGGHNGYAVMGQAGATKEFRYDAANRRAYIIASRSINIINLNTDFTIDSDKSGSYPTRIFDISSPAESLFGDYAEINTYANNTLLPDNTTFVKIFSTSSATTGTHDGNKTNYLTTVDIKQAGSWGYPLTVNQANTAGNDVISYGLGNGTLLLENAIPQTKLEDFTAVTPTVGVLGRIPKSSWDATVKALATISLTNVTSNSDSFTFGQYTGLDKGDDYYVPISMDAVSLVPEDNKGLVIDDDTGYISVGLVITSITNSESLSGVFSYIVDGFIVAATTSITTVATNVPNRPTNYVIDIRNATKVQVVLASDKNIARVYTYTKED